MPFKRRAWSMSGKKDKISVLWYIDARDVMDLLDKVIWPDNRQSEHYEIKWSLFCRLWIKTNDEWLWKSDCWSESKVEKEKWEASDALKRAAVQRGIGRFLYTLPSIWMPCDGKKPVDNKWKIVRDVTKYVNDNYKMQLNQRHTKHFPKEEVKIDPKDVKTTDLFKD